MGKNKAVQTEPVLVHCLFEFLLKLEVELYNEFRLKRVARSTEVVAYFTPKPLENTLKRGLPVLYLAIRTYTREGLKTVGPRVEIGTRDIRYSMLLKAAGSKWKQDTFEKYAPLDFAIFTLFLESDKEMTDYDPVFLHNDEKASLDLLLNVRIGAKELYKLYNRST